VLSHSCSWTLNLGTQAPPLFRHSRHSPEHAVLIVHCALRMFHYGAAQKQKPPADVLRRCSRPELCLFRFSRARGRHRGLRKGGWIRISLTAKCTQAKATTRRPTGRDGPCGLTAVRRAGWAARRGSAWLAFWRTFPVVFVCKAFIK